MVLYGASVSLRRLAHACRSWLLGESAITAPPTSTAAAGRTRARSSSRTGSARRREQRQRARTLSIMARQSRGKAGHSWTLWVLTLLGLFVLGTFIVLSTVKHFFGTNELDFITSEEVRAFRFEAALPFNASMPPAEQLEEEQRTGLKREKIPRIIHQTWKTSSLPERWVAVRKDCMRMLPDYEFKMWTDASAREFIQTEYPSFLATWDSYREFGLYRCGQRKLTVLQLTIFSEPTRSATLCCTSTVASIWIWISDAERTLPL